MTGKAENYFDTWGAYRDTTDAAKSHEELLGKDYATRRKLNRSAKEGMQSAGDPMDVGAIIGCAATLDMNTVMMEFMLLVSKARDKAKYIATCTTTLQVIGRLGEGRVNHDSTPCNV